MQKFILILILVLFSESACNKEDIPDKITGTYVFDFEEDLEGWEPIFADYPEGEDLFYELHASRESLPEPLDTDLHGLMISGNNHSDDLFMGLLKKMDGLTPNTSYSVIFNLDIASETPQNSFGIGGSPGASVYVKVGATPVKPELDTDDQEWLRLNIDKGNQAAEGTDMINIGTVGTPLEEFIYTIITRSNSDSPFTVISNDKGEIWLLAGTDSGFEGKTILYYDRIEVILF
jgi:hypothetical protein